MGLQRFEHRLERLVEGAFTKAFRSGLQPVEIGRRVVRELDARRTLGVRGTVIPNEVVVRLSQEDLERFQGFHDALTSELAEAVRDHARENRLHFVGPVVVTLLADPEAKRGDLAVSSAIVEGEEGVGALVLPDGRRVQLGDDPAIIGRMPECAVPLSDPQASRRHAEVARAERGYRLTDLGSTNGTLLNGNVVTEHPLADGDVIQIGATSIRYEES